MTNAISAGFFLDSIDYRGNPVVELQDKRVRQALNYAVDKNAINQSFYGGRAVVMGQVPVPATFGHNPAVQPYPFDQARARQLLAEAGYPNGFTMDMEARPSSPEFADVAVVVRSSLDQVGVRGGLVQITDSALALEKFNGRAPRPPLFGWLLGAGGGLFDADPQLATFLGTAPVGTLHYRNPEYDALVLASRQELDTSKRRDLLHQAVVLMREEAPWLFLNRLVSFMGVQNKVTAAGSADAWPLHDEIYRLK